MLNQLFFKKNKLEIIKINKNELQGGSIVCFVQHINGPYAIDESVKNIIEEENPVSAFFKKIKNFIIFFCFYKIIFGNKNRIFLPNGNIFSNSPFDIT